MEIFDAIDLVGRVHSKWNPVQTLATHDAGETLRVVRFSSGPEDPLENRLQTNGAFLQRIQVVLLAERLIVDRIKRFSLQIDLTLAARKAFDVVNLIHGRATRVLSNNPTPALDTVPKVVPTQVRHIIIASGHRLLHMALLGRRSADATAATVHVRVQRLD